MTEEKESNDDQKRSRRKRNELSLQAHGIKVQAKSVDESVAELSEVCGKRMQSIMEHHLRGEMMEIEKREVHPLFRDMGDD